MHARRDRVPNAHVLLAMALAAAAGLLACDKVPLTAPTQSFIQLFATDTSVPPNGSVEIIANVTEQAGTPVQNGTVVTFVTSMGRMDPAEARTHNGKATSRLIADGRSGVATVTAFSGAAESASIEIPIGAAAIGSLTVSASPATLPSGGGSVEVTARVSDLGGNPLAGIPVTFSTTAGTVSPAAATTDQTGAARTTLTTDREATVTARVAQETADVTVGVGQAPGLAVSVSPNPPIAKAATQFAVTVVVPPGGTAADRLDINFGDGDRTSLRIPASGGTTTVSHVYDREGTFTVTVTVVDVSGGRQTQQLVVTVVPAPAI